MIPVPTPTVRCISFCCDVSLVSFVGEREQNAGMERRRESERGDELSCLLDERFGERGGTSGKREEDGRESVVVLRAFKADRSSFDRPTTSHSRRSTPFIPSLRFLPHHSLLPLPLPPLPSPRRSCACPSWSTSPASPERAREARDLERAARVADTDMDMDPATDTDTAADREMPSLARARAPASLARAALASPERERALASPERDRGADTAADTVADTTATTTRVRTASTATSRKSGHKNRADYVGERSNNLDLFVWFLCFLRTSQDKPSIESYPQICEEIKKKRREGTQKRNKVSCALVSAVQHGPIIF